MTHPAIDILMNHRTIRSFKADPVDAQTLELILKAGTRAATPAEMQFYSLIVVDDSETLKRLDVRSPVAIVACVDLYRHNRWMAIRHASPLQGTAPDLLFCFWDVALTLQNMATAAESMGLGTLTAIREMPGLFDLPEGVYPAAVLAVGYPDENPALRNRFPLHAVVHHASYQRPTDDEIIDWYGFIDAKWESLPVARREALQADSCENFAHVLSSILRKETGWISNNLKGTGFRAAGDN